jgi:hypothetical protein
LDYCSECGVALPTGGYTEGSDAEIYPELARSNLLRMRGEYKQAEDVCLAILRRFPNNASANVLLGDICAERGDLEHAIEWYELAGDIQPDTAAVRAKFDAVKQRKAEREAATTAKQLGLPTTRPRGVFVAVGLLVFIGCVGVIAYSVGRGYVPPKAQTVVESPIDVPGEVVPTKVAEDRPPVENTTPVAPTPANPKEDRDLIATLTQKAHEGSRIVDASQDPRSKDVIVTFRCIGAEDKRYLAARLGASVFGLVADANKVTVRGVESGKLALVADLSRVAVQQAAELDSQEAGQDPTPWVDAVLTNVWPEESAAQGSGG